MKKGKLSSEEMLPEYDFTGGECGRYYGKISQASGKVRIRKSTIMKQMEKIIGGPLTLGRVIGALRKSDEISLMELAQKVGISKTYLCDIEKGRKRVPLALSARFADAMGHSVSSFVQLVLYEEFEKSGLRLHLEVSAA
jgi:DNA-binding XRE family transcriptional regulator